MEYGISSAEYKILGHHGKEIIPFIFNSQQHDTINIQVSKTIFIVLAFYNNGNFKRFGYIDGVLNDYGYTSGKVIGKSIEWYENGQIKSYNNYDGTDEERHNTHKSWYEDGTFENDGIKIYYEDGSIQQDESGDECIKYFKNGKVECIYPKHWYINGKKITGYFKDFYDNGKPWQIAYKKDGAYEGEQKEWYENGKLKEIKNWKNGLKNGMCQEYYKNGQLKTEQHYQNDQIVGSYKEWKFGNKNYDKPDVIKDYGVLHK